MCNIGHKTQNEAKQNKNTLHRKQQRLSKATIELGVISKKFMFLLILSNYCDRRKKQYALK